MFEKLKENLMLEKKIISDIMSIESSMAMDPQNKNMYLLSINALRSQLNLMNNTVPELIKEWSSIDKKKIEVPNLKVQQTVNVSYTPKNSKNKTYITINKKDKKDFVKKLKLSEDSFNAISEQKDKNSGQVISKPNNYVKISNKFFRKFSDSISPQFENLGNDLKRSNSRYMLSSYLSMAIMSFFLASIFGFLIFAGLIYLSLDNWFYIVIPVGLSGLVMVIFYMYPSNVATTTQKKISQELPFVSIYMAAIASSNITPVKIFKIIASSNEYPNVAKELRKVLAQIEIYGYNLVVALKNVAKRTSNKDLAEMFSGLASNISTGGVLKTYLEKKAEGFLNNYRLEREKYTELAGTFMDVYISILIAAPLILMMMFIVMNVAGLGIGGLSITMLLFMSVFGIIIINIIFIVVLNMKQPKV